MSEMILHQSHHDKAYVIVEKQTIDDPRLSFKALGLLTYIISKPAHWRICLKQLAGTHTDGYSAVCSAMHELIACNYAKRTLVRNELGQVVGYQTIVSEIPFSPEASDEISVVSDSGKTEADSTEISFSRPSKEGIKKGLKKEKIPLLTVSPKKAKSCSTYDQDATQVLDHLNAVTKSAFRSTGLIPLCLKKGYSVDECILVIDWLDQERRKREPEWVAQYLDHSTPFRVNNFDKYLQKAKAWKSSGGKSTTEEQVERVMAKMLAERRAHYVQ